MCVCVCVCVCVWVCVGAWDEKAWVHDVMRYFQYYVYLYIGQLPTHPRK